jgi:hypothetical protein
LLAEGLMARASREEFTVVTTRGEVDMGRGSIFVPLARQDADADAIHALMETIAREDGLPVHAATSGLTPTTGRDLGATNVFSILEQPRVVLAFDGGLSRYDVGEIWWTMDYRHDMAVTLVEKGDLGRVDWSDYTHLILVGGNASLPDNIRDEVDRWIRREGGTLIATRQGARWAQEAFSTMAMKTARRNTAKTRRSASTSPRWAFATPNMSLAGRSSRPISTSPTRWASAMPTANFRCTAMSPSRCSVLRAIRTPCRCNTPMIRC